MDDRMRRFTTTYGRINLSNSSGTLGVFRVITDSPDYLRKESAVTSGKVDQGSKESYKSTRHADIGGGFTRCRVSHPEGTILVIMAGTTRRAVRYNDGAVFVRLRQGADLIQIAYNPPTGPESVLDRSIQAFLGEADVLSAEELRMFGVPITKEFKDRYLNREEIDELLRIEVVRPGAIGRPTLVAVATSEGTVIRAVGTEAKRRVKIRRR